MKKKPAYLFGPFVGDLSWEFFRFAPFAIYIKKQHPKIPLIVFTRENNFDLYGDYANILVPLRIPNDSILTRNCFKVEKLTIKDYNRIANKVCQKYKKRFDIIEHYYPDIGLWRYKIRWQFPRRLMDYDFKPRRGNKIITDQLIKNTDILIDNISLDYYKDSKVINSADLISKTSTLINNYDSSIIGVLIESIKTCRFVVGNLNSYLSHLALLLKKPLICINNEKSMDEIKLINPLNTLILFEDNITMGIEKWK